MKPAILEYYRQHSPMTDPGSYAHLYAGLPETPAELAQVVHHLLMHRQAIEYYHITLPPQQRAEQRLRSVAERLERLVAVDNDPVVVPREPAQRQVGVCRDFAVFYVSLLRHRGIPARMRVGYADYLDPRSPFHFDHWIVEYWDAAQGRWLLTDPEVDDLYREVVGIPGDLNELRHDQDFYLAGSAWRLARSGAVRPDMFRYSGRWKGLPAIRFNLLHDFQALNRLELSVQDGWDDLIRKKTNQLTPDEWVLLDRIAELTLAADDRFDELRALFDSLPRTQQLYARLSLLGYSVGESAAAPADTAGGLEQLAAMTSRQPPAAPPPPLRRARKAPVENNSTETTNGGYITVRGARQHNLQNITVRIPRNKLVVITGVSGSGKSSLAFDTIYAEGQRRYVESLSAYTRQFMEQMEKPQVDQITGLSPAIAIEQKTISRNPRSTVGTVTDILDYLRVLYARIGVPHCPRCGRNVQPQSAQQITDQLAALPPETRFHILAPIVRNRPGTFANLLRKAVSDGYSRARINGTTLDLTAGIPPLEKTKKHHIDLVIDRLVIPADGEDADFRTRLMDSVETALKAAEGVITIQFDADEVILSAHNACPACEISFSELEPALFSFNSPLGMCDQCNGLGVQLQVDPNLIITQPQLSLLDGASPWYRDLRKKGDGAWQVRNLHAIARHYGVDIDQPWNALPEAFRNVILYGSQGEKVHFQFETEDGSWKGESNREVMGVVYHINRLFRQTRSEYTRRWYMSFMSQLPCPKCQGERLCPEARAATVGGRRLPEVTHMSIGALHDWIAALPTQLDAEALEIGGELIEEIRQRLSFMRNVGLHYLTLDRPAPTLSGGEGQRIRLAAQIGSGLVGVLYVLDEPSIGLHARDQRALLDTLTRLRNLGNTVLVVEHDAATMLAADHLIDLGPGPGILGGKLVAAGTPQEVMANPASLTGRYLSGELRVTAPNGIHRRAPQGWLTIKRARLHNLKNITARFPLGCLICVTGVSGSGKSSLIAQTLHPALTRALHNAQSVPGAHDAIEGLEQVDKVINITQEPIGRNPRSNPGTYAGVLDDIRQVFTSLPDARVLGYKAGRFSFNVRGGRCEACAGYGFKRVEMHFLADVWVKCKECGGKRFNRQTLAVAYKGRNIADVLEMDVQEALDFFSPYPEITRILRTLHAVGLDYIKLGQSALTLSGGEAQRVKLAKELSRKATGRTIYILDEPTTGLHFADIQRLLDVLHILVDAGNTVIIIEHNLDVIKSADWILDLGPEGGEAGGNIVAAGTPEQVAQAAGSFTGAALQAYFAAERRG